MVCVVFVGVAVKPLLLDLFCGAGGAGMGYHRAGFEVVGVDINPQPNYPFEFIQFDALKLLPNIGKDFRAIHASPPCQFYSGMSVCRPGLSDDYPDLIGPTRELLIETGVPWVIENVRGARKEMLNPFMLCGAMFGLELYRHRLFESSEFVWQPEHPKHVISASKAGHWKPGTYISVSGNCSPIALARKSMGIDWMTRAELAESIPPAFTEYIGEQLMAHLEVAA